MRIFITACAALGVVALGGGTASAATSADCHDLAIAYANQHANPVAGTVGGGIIGGVAGGLLGKMLGKGNRGVAPGIAIGVGTGAVLGATQAKKRHDQLYLEKYYECVNTPMPTQVYYEIPPAGSAEWNYYCSLKYRSFEAADGTFQPFPPYENAPLPPRRVCVLP